MSRICTYYVLLLCNHDTYSKNYLWISDNNWIKNCHKRDIIITQNKRCQLKLRSSIGFLFYIYTYKMCD